jgi:hypothetical protein
MIFFYERSRLLDFLGLINSLFASVTLVNKEPGRESSPFVGEVIGLLPGKV